jgi:trehalose-6-phosphate hydrolase
MKDNVFDFYRALIFIRKHKEVLIDGDYKLLNPGDNSVYSYERFNEKRKILVMANFTAQEQKRTIPTGFDLVLGNYGGLQLDNGTVIMRPYEALMLEKR